MLLMPERCFFASSRWRRWAFGTFVGRRGVGGIAACRIRPKRRSRASSRLRSCARWRWAMMTMTPSLVTRLPARRIKRSATSFGSDGERRASKRSCTADETLLTFWPPGPEARTKDSDSSDSLIEIVSVTGIMPHHGPSKRDCERLYAFNEQQCALQRAGAADFQRFRIFRRSIPFAGPVHAREFNDHEAPRRIALAFDHLNSAGTDDIAAAIGFDGG